MNEKTAIVFGATGLVGSLLVEELIQSPDYSEIRIIGRRSSGFQNPEIIEEIIDFDDPDSFGKKISGNDLFICLGTTIKKAGSVARMEQIDRDLPVEIARTARKNGVQKVAVVSSIGANKRSGNYYLRIKGEMEAGISALNFENTAILRPSIILGERSEKRFGEKTGKVFIGLFQFLLVGKLRKYRGVHASTIARAMIRILQNNSQKSIYESNEIQQIGS